MRGELPGYEEGLVQVDWEGRADWFIAAREAGGERGGELSEFGVEACGVVLEARVGGRAEDVGEMGEVGGFDVHPVFGGVVDVE